MARTVTHFDLLQSMNDIWLNPMTARADSWVKLDSHVENVVQNFGRRYRVPEERCDDIKQGMMLSLIVLSRKSEEVPKPEAGSPGIPYVNTMVKNRFIDGFRGRRTFVEWKTAHHDLFETPETQTVTIAMYGEVARTLKKVIQTYWMGEDRDRHFQKIYDLACYTAVYLQGLRITHPGTNKIDVLLAGWKMLKERLPQPQMAALEETLAAKYDTIYRRHKRTESDLRRLVTQLCGNDVFLHTILTRVVSVRTESSTGVSPQNRWKDPCTLPAWWLVLQTLAEIESGRLGTSLCVAWLEAL